MLTFHFYVTIQPRYFTEGPRRPKSPVNSTESKLLQNHKLYL